jgi:hypothetical protein
MPQTVNINGVAISYPIIGDTEWGVEATKFAELVGVVLQKIGQGNQSTTNNIVIGSISSPGNLTVASGDLSVSGNTTLTGNLTANGNTTLGNANTDTIVITGILNVDSGTLYVNPTDNRVGINDSSPSEALDVVGNALVSGTLGVTGAITGASATLTNLTVDTNLIITNSTDNRVGINTTSPQEALDVTGKVLVSSDITVGGVIVADDSTNVTTAPPISFTGDLNTGIGHSAADTLDFVTGGQSRFRIEPTGQIKAVYESTLGTDYNTQLDNGYLCRAWVNFDGTSSNLTGTYTRSGNTITISITSHGLSTGQTVYLDFTTGGATDGVYVVTVVNANSYTVTDTVSGTITTSNVTQFRYIRASGNVSSITDNGTGHYTINFLNPMPDINYSAIASSGLGANVASNDIFTCSNFRNAPTISSCDFGTLTGGRSLVDVNYMSIGIFR